MQADTTARAGERRGAPPRSAAHGRTAPGPARHRTPGTGRARGNAGPRRHRARAVRKVRCRRGAARLAGRNRQAIVAARLGSARLGSARLGSARLGSARLGSARLGSARLGSARLGSARLGSARLGSARLGSARLGSARLLIVPAKLSITEFPPLGQARPLHRHWYRNLSPMMHISYELGVSFCSSFIFLS